MIENLKYTAVIRTLGKAGDKYQQLLESLHNQSIKPVRIIVYIAEGYPIPIETINIEEYIYVKKGMVAQRALSYDEVNTEYILFLDDDVYLPQYAVEKMYVYLLKYNADVISPDVFPNAERSFFQKCIMFFSGRMMPRKDDKKWGYKVMRNSGYSYNSNPRLDIYLSQTNAGPCFFCKRKDFLKIHFNEELWMDNLKYAQGDDQVMFYKMYLEGLKLLTWFHSGIKHLDAKSTMENKDKKKILIYSDFRFKIIFWHRFIYLPDKYFFSRLYSILAICYTCFFTLFISLLKCNIDILKLKWKAIKDGVSFIRSKEYKDLPRIVKYK